MKLRSLVAVLLLSSAASAQTDFNDFLATATFVMRMQDNTTGTTVVESISANNGTLQGATNTSDISEAAGPNNAYPRALHLDDASAQHITFTAHGGDAASNGSWIWWFRHDAGGTNYIASDGATPRIQSAATGVSYVDGGTNTFSTTINDGTWYHLVMSRDSSDNCRCFINGVQVGTTQVLNNRLTFAKFGRRGSVSSYFDGYMCGAMYLPSTISTDAQASQLHLGPEPEILTNGVPTGTQQVGQTLTANFTEDYPAPFAGITDIGTVTYAYQWQNDGGTGSWANIGSATNSTYTLQASDEGDDIRVLITPTDSVTGSGSQSTSTETGAIAGAGGGTPVLLRMVLEHAR